MAIAVRSTRGGGSGGVGAGFRSLFSYRIFISALFSLLFIATVSVLLTSRPPPTHHHSKVIGKWRFTRWWEGVQSKYLVVKVSSGISKIASGCTLVYKKFPRETEFESGNSCWRREY
ncbi:hypothetical protein GOBAR_DD16610 [Gossypium barbadense]|nr:hypothetical protein GOBAR_DD16610 [Gossypium barbadense]